MLHVTLNITLSLEGPILTKSSTPGHYGIDAAMAENHKGKYYIPGSLIKGRLKQSWEELREAVSYIQKDEIKNLLGEGSDNRDDTSDNREYNEDVVNPKRGLIIFSDFTSEKTGVRILHRIRMDEKRGAVDTGALLVMETPFAPGEKACFNGTIKYLVTDKAKAARIIDLIEKGLRWTTNLGSHCTVGFGKLINVAISQTVNPLQVDDVEATGIVHENNDQIGIQIQPQAPFCIAKRRISQNLFESETVIPGSVIKGAIASMWCQLLEKGSDVTITENTDSQRKELSKYFERIRFRHAFPAESSKPVRPVTPPLSLCKERKDKDLYDVYDLVMHNDPILINGKAPNFEVDWKNRSDVDKDFGWTTPHMELRVRTKIKRSKRKAEKNKLFAYEMVIPDGIHWLSWIDLGHIPENDRDSVKKQLSNLLAFGLNGWGKTKVSADVTLKDTNSIKPKYKSQLTSINDQHFITLQTPAILCDPRMLNETSSRDELFNAYKAAWKQLSNDSLTLVRYFARQSLSGGYYLHKRFQANKQYEPYLLTEGGSVFVLAINEGKEPDASKNLEEWYKNGLPLPEWAITRYRDDRQNGDHWTNCPYIPENGYGEIAVNMTDVHIEKKPPKNRCKEVRNAV